MNIGYFSAV